MTIKDDHLSAAVQTARFVPATGSPEAVVVERIPAFRYGLQAALDHAGFVIQYPADPVGWCDTESQRVIVLALEGAVEWEMLTEIQSHPQRATVVSVIDECSSSDCRDALAAGADSVVPRNVPLTTLMHVITSALEGESLLPSRWLGH